MELPGGEVGGLDLMVVSEALARKGISRAEGEYLDRRISAAPRRYLAATKALAQVRRLQLPEIRIQL